MSTELITPSAVDAVQLLPRDLAVVKMENDQIFTLSAARPRNMEAIKKELADTIHNFPQFADEAIYEKPVGKGEDGKQKFARGLSVRAAEALAECYGFNRIHTDVEVLPDDRVKIYASFTDFQKGRVWEDATIVSPFYKGRNGAMQRHPEDRFLNVIVKSEKSKLVREVINRSVNQPLKSWFENECEKQLAKTLDDATCQKIIDGFKAFGMGKEDVENVVGRPMAMGWTSQDRIRMGGVYNALKAGETTVAELLDRDPQPAVNKLPTTSGTVEGLSNPKGKAEERPAPTPTPDPMPATTEQPPPAIEWAEWTRRIANASNLTFVRALEDEAARDVPMPERQQLLELLEKRKADIRAARGKPEEGKLV